MRLKCFVAILVGLICSSCVKEEHGRDFSNTGKGLSFKLYESSYSHAMSRSSSEERVSQAYDRLEYYIVDRAGEKVPNIKTKYIPETSEIVAEGLKEGDYTLLVLGVRGDYYQDGVTIHTLNTAADTWLSFPEKIENPLVAEYFYSSTPFSVELHRYADGTEEEVVVLDKKILQKRIVSRLDFMFHYENPYIKTAVLENKLRIEKASFSRHLSGNGVYSGETEPFDIQTDGSNEGAVCLVPESPYPLAGVIEMTTRSYEKGGTHRMAYTFEQKEVKRNVLNEIRTRVVHPYDKSGLMFITEQAYRAGEHGQILQDGEPKSVYTVESQRKFNTMQPLQVGVTDEGRLHVRFYSPRGLKEVKIKAKIPAVGNEVMEFAYFDSIPPFADFYEEIPLLQKTLVYQTESGRLLEVAPVGVDELKQAEWIIESDCAYWKKLKEIKYGWDISFDLYGGDPDKPDGAPNGNWMGIRPVHCREAVAFFLNYTCLLSFTDTDELIKANPEKLFNDQKELVLPEVVLEQMRIKRDLRTGLIYQGNGVAGLGGGRTWGVAEWIYFQHYTNAYACNLALHEIGHVMGYGHSSAFTYGPWAQELMNHHYVSNIQRLPIDSPLYLDSKNNPNKYY